MKHRFFAAICLNVFFTAVLFCGSAFAAFPEKTLTIYVPWNAGSNTDMQIRIFQPFLKKYLPEGSNLIVVNKGGGSGTIGTTAFLGEKPDGHTILFTLPTPIVFKPIAGGLQYSYDNLQAVARFSMAPMLIVVRNDAPYKDAKELIEYIKNNPGKFSFGHGGKGGIAHLAFEKFLFGEKLKAINVPFAGGTAECYSAVMGGHVNSYIPGLQDYAGRDGVRALINLGSPTEELKDVPTFEDLGYKGYVTDNFSGFYFMKGVPKDIEAVWVTAIEKALNDPEFKQTAEKAGLGTNFAGPDAFDAQIKSAIESSRTVMKEMGLAK